MPRKDLHNLIRLRKWDVDEKQRALATLLRQEESVLERQAALEEQIAHEMAFAAQAPVELRATLSAYLERADDMRARIAAVLQDVRQRIAVVQENLAEAYRRLKTFEVTQEKREEEEEKELARLEEIDLNEMGLNLHRRRTEAEAL